MFDDIKVYIYYAPKCVRQNRIVFVCNIVLRQRSPSSRAYECFFKHSNARNLQMVPSLTHPRCNIVRENIYIFFF